MDFWNLSGGFKGYNMAKAGLEKAIWAVTSLKENISIAQHNVHVAYDVTDMKIHKLDQDIS